MARNSFTDRIKITRRGKVRRRATTLGHSRGNKRQTQMNRKKRERNLVITKKVLSKYL